MKEHGDLHEKLQTLIAAASLDEELRGLLATHPLAIQARARGGHVGYWVSDEHGRPPISSRKHTVASVGAVHSVDGPLTHGNGLHSTTSPAALRASLRMNGLAREPRLWMVALWNVAHGGWSDSLRGSRREVLTEIAWPDA